MTPVREALALPRRARALSAAAADRRNRRPGPGVAYVNHNVAPELQAPPATLRIAAPGRPRAADSISPTGAASAGAWLRREIEATGDPELVSHKSWLSPGAAAAISATPTLNESLT